MVLEFIDYKKKIKKSTYLELDFKVNSGDILTVVSNDPSSVDIFIESLRGKTSYKGKIILNDEKLEKEKLVLIDDYGFYNHLSLLKNFQIGLSLFKIKFLKEDLIALLEEINLGPNTKYKKLLRNEKIKYHILFSILINQSMLVIDNTEKTLTYNDKEQIRELILSKSTNENIVILDTTLNEFNDIADSVLVISDGIKSYYGPLDDLLIIKSLAAVSISNQDSLETILSNYQYTIYNDHEIVVREAVLEEVVYQLLKNNIEVYQIRNLGEKIKLYKEEGE